ncbi:hypothetical protein MPSEU_000455500 [Mayamaea pseudoterrestris]|nr:hypothetical protein MPSEU_000455500 [Mayamaea pseudoterrestris]
MLLTMNPSSIPWQPPAQTQATSSSVVPQYTDYSCVPDAVSSFCADEAGRKSMEQFFPVKLHILLSELEKDGRSDIIGWSPHGRAFHVHKQDKFVSEIIPKWFRQTGYSSFRRQINLYGFKRITSGRDKGAYWHELFLRGKCFLADRMERVKLTGPVQKGRKRNSPETEPNFYMMQPLPLNAAHSSNEYGRGAPLVSPSLQSASSIVSSSAESTGSFLNQAAPRMTALELLQRQCYQNSMGAPNMNGLLGQQAPQQQTSQLTEAQLAQLVRPLLLQHAEQQHHHQHHHQQHQVHDLETQLLLQEQIKIVRARLVAQILSQT